MTTKAQTEADKAKPAKESTPKSTAPADPAEGQAETFSAPVRVKNKRGEDITDEEASTEPVPAAWLVLPVIVGDAKEPSVTLSQRYPVLGAVRGVTVGSREYAFAGVKRNAELNRTENRLKAVRVQDKDELAALIKDGDWTQE